MTQQINTSPPATPPALPPESKQSLFWRGVQDLRDSFEDAPPIDENNASRMERMEYAIYPHYLFFKGCGEVGYATGRIVPLIGRAVAPLTTLFAISLGIIYKLLKLALYYVAGHSIWYSVILLGIATIVSFILLNQLIRSILLIIALRAAYDLVIKKLIDQLPEKWATRIHNAINSLDYLEKTIANKVFSYLNDTKPAEIILSEPIESHVFEHNVSLNNKETVSRLGYIKNMISHIGNILSYLMSPIKRIQASLNDPFPEHQMEVF